MTIDKKEIIHIPIYHNNECIDIESIREEFENDIRFLIENELNIMENLKD